MFQDESKFNEWWDNVRPTAVGITEWQGNKKPWPSDRNMRIWAFSEDDLHLAMSVLVKKGEIYCWMDSLCIDQDSQEEKEREINRMGEYYANSKNCYIFPRGIGQLGGPCGSIPGWYYRVWTLQELIMSKNPVHIYIVEDKTLGLRISETIGAVIISHADAKEYIKNKNMDILWRDTPLTKLEIMRIVGYRESTYEEDKIYGILALLGVKNVEIKYGIGLRSAIQTVANSMHIDQRLLLSAVEWAGSGWIDGYCAVPTFIPGCQAWGLDITHVCGQAVSLGERGTEITSLMSMPMKIFTMHGRVCDATSMDDRAAVTYNIGESVCNLICMEVPITLSWFERNAILRLMRYASEYIVERTIEERSKKLVRLGYGRLGSSHNFNFESRLIVVGKSTHVDAHKCGKEVMVSTEIDKINEGFFVVAIICQPAGNVLHKTGLCVIDSSVVDWSIGRAVVA